MIKKDLLILHGALGAKSQFQKLSEILSDNFNVHLLNFEGHGGEKSERDFSIDNFSQNLIDYLNKNNLKSVLVFGYSMGGYVALNACREYPGYIEKIITLGTKFAWTQETAEQEIKMLDPEKIKEKVPRFAESLKKRHHPDKWEEVLHKTKAMMIELGNGKALNIDHFERIDVTVKIMVGEMDKMVNLDESRKVAKHIPGAQLEVLKNCQHPIEKIDAHFLAEKVEDYLLSSTA